LTPGLQISIGSLSRRHCGCTRGLDLNLRFLHFLNNEPDHLFRVLGLVEHRIDVRVDDVSESSEDIHVWLFLSMLTQELAQRVPIIGAIS
jgi:hypothetical protein